MLGAPPAGCFGRNRLLDATFRSPVSTTLSSSRGGVAAPGLRLRLPHQAAHRTVRPLTPALTVSGRDDHRLKPVSGFFPGASNKSSHRRSPLGFSPLRIKALDTAPRQMACLARKPDCLLLPGSRHLVKRQPPDHRSRLATSRQARCSRSRIVAMSFCEPRSWTRVLSS